MLINLDRLVIGNHEVICCFLLNEWSSFEKGNILEIQFVNKETKTDFFVV